MGELNEVSVSRRDFLKGVTAAAVGVAAVGAGVASLATPAFSSAKAFAATGNAIELTSGTYVVTANVYVDSSDTPIGQNAYVTNDGTPPFNMPTSPVPDNATLVVSEGGQKFLTVPIVNETFGVLSIASQSVDGSVSIASTQTTAWNPSLDLSNSISERISSITFDVSNFDESDGNIATFSPCSEFANFLLYMGNKDWDLHLVADYSTAQLVS